MVGSGKSRIQKIPKKNGHPSKVPYSLWDHSPFLKAFFKKSVTYFGVHMKDAKCWLFFSFFFNLLRLKKMCHIKIKEIN